MACSSTSPTWWRTRAATPCRPARRPGSLPNSASYATGRIRRSRRASKPRPTPDARCPPHRKGATRDTGSTFTDRPSGRAARQDAVTPATRPGVTGVVLAGGRGRRMGAADKGLLDFHGQPIVAHVIRRFAGQVDELLVNANRNVARYETFGYRVLRDATGEFLGPLAGLQGAMRTARHEWIATVPCDSPFLPVDLVARLRRDVENRGARAAVARSGGRLHPVFSICSRSLLCDLDDYLAAGGRRVMEWFGRAGAVEVDFDDESQAFENINGPDDLARLQSAAPPGSDA
ncbi:MAG: molybdenum cofactor guanylyltransferase [Betaproteobacteria bacterium]|nr:molybdenum cofactor guanylyltransferase [Betaproteobacteria bacterium]